MTDQDLYQHCRETVAMVEALKDFAAVHGEIGKPVQLLPIGDFFITSPDLSITYCDLVELHHFRGCAIRIGYINQQIKKVRGMPLAHWVSPRDNT